MAAAPSDLEREQIFSMAEKEMQYRGEMFNKTCKVCNSITRNVIGPNDVESTQQTNESSAASAPVSEARSCLYGRRFLYFLLACMVFVFAISWFVHFNIPS